MKKSATYFLQVVIVLFGLGVLTFLIWQPQLEGRNADASFFKTYLTDPFLAYIYLTSVLFFVALFQAFRLLREVRNNRIFSLAAMKALRTAKYCAFVFAGLIIAADVYIRLTITGDDDPAGAIMLGMIVTVISTVVGTMAAVFERVVQKGVEMKSENDLTI